MNENERQEKREKIQAEIRGLQNLLQQHDYIGAKIAMGRATVDEYADEIAQSNEWAAKINELQDELEQLDVKEVNE